MTASATPFEAFSAQGLGVRTLAGLVDKTEAGVVVLDAGRRIVYGNHAACRLLGRPLLELRGHDLLERVPAAEHPSLQTLLNPDRAEPPASFSTVVLSADDSEKDITGSACAVESDGPARVVVTMWDLSGRRSAMRTAAALAQTAALTDQVHVDVILARIARYAVEGTRAVGCEVLVAGQEGHGADSAHGQYFCTGPSGRLTEPAHRQTAGWAARWVDSMSAGVIHLGSVRVKPVVLPDARALWRDDPIAGQHVACLANLDYRAGIAVPLSWQNRVIGLCVLYLPAEVAVVSEHELGFATALADQAALTIINARLTEQAGEVAALQERAKLARDLHDSVSQSLFALTMHARAAQLAMSKAGNESIDPISGSLGEVASLTRSALAEMRALIFELRPDAVVDDGLVAALRQQAAALAAREGFLATVDGPEHRVPIDEEVEEQLYRIGVEALYNVAKHARADHVHARVQRNAGSVWLTVTDDGVGFDTQRSNPGHLGLATMSERALRINARLNINSVLGEGTVVTVAVGTQDEPEPPPPS